MSSERRADDPNSPRVRARSRFLKQSLQFREDGVTRDHAPLSPSGDGILRRDNVGPLAPQLLLDVSPDLARWPWRTWRAGQWWWCPGGDEWSGRPAGGGRQGRGQGHLGGFEDTAIALGAESDDLGDALGLEPISQAGVGLVGSLGTVLAAVICSWTPSRGPKTSCHGSELLAMDSSLCWTNTMIDGPRPGTSRRWPGGGCEDILGGRLDAVGVWNAGFGVDGQLGLDVDDE